jgi:hypothetical protein
VCVCACVRACVRARACACVRVCTTRARAHTAPHADPLGHRMMSAMFSQMKNYAKAVETMQRVFQLEPQWCRRTRASLMGAHAARSDTRTSTQHTRARARTCTHARTHRAHRGCMREGELAKKSEVKKKFKKRKFELKVQSPAGRRRPAA